MDTVDISWINLFLGLSILFIPIYILYIFKTKLVKDSIISASRMFVQLLFVGFYLEFLFKLNLWWINILWVVVMLVFASFTLVNRSGASWRYLLIPNLISLSLSLIIVNSLFLLLIIQNNVVFEARYLIPISGMLLGNAMQNSIISLNSFFTDIKNNQLVYKFALGNGAKLNEALRPYIKESLVKASNPSIASMAVMGLIALPGTMTGQIIGGSSPSLAIKYQIMLMVVIFAANTLSSFLSIKLSVKNCFDAFGNIKKGVLK